MTEPQQEPLDVPVPAIEVPVEPEGFDVEDFPGGARSTIEAILMVVDQPLTPLELADALELEEHDVREHLLALEDEYALQQRGFTIREINGGWRVYSRADYAPAVEKFLLGGQQAKLTQASLETLAVIAYRQPISRARVGAVRGVNVDGVIRTLTTRGLIAEMGTDGDGGAMLYGTTPYFLQRMGLSSLDELPALAPYLPETDVIDELIEQGHA
ncbi:MULTISPECIES: SMC-Scp complex subunit ScpB [Yimella]|uniref:Condensin subunit ScpB n=1 Tax=Yimella lutea TaxID=587872 RepID=A0A542EGD8_9MICO|nr:MULTISPECIES: SMC-Scp complex subunit ScpB [Yimella]MCG8655439.1 SMC-Scp complex subunit ScpB [Yimella sp. NH-Cas1]TQJ14379.1 condensin subunit ScpB [Yimella lutea]